MRVQFRCKKHAMSSPQGRFVLLYVQSPRVMHALCYLSAYDFLEGYVHLSFYPIDSIEVFVLPIACASVRPPRSECNA